MMFFMILTAAAGLIIGNQSEEVSSPEVMMEITETDPQFEQDQGRAELKELILNPEIENQASIDKGVDREMASILKEEKTPEEMRENMIPQFEDLSHLAMRPSITVASAPSSELENPYALLPISIVEKQKISDLLTTMADNNVFKLLFEKKRLEKLGRDINHVHPIRFLGSVFSDPHLVECMFEIRRSGFKWDGFMDGFSKRFLEEVNAGNVEAFVPGFASSLNVTVGNVMRYINYKDRDGFEQLILYLMKECRRR